MKKLILLFCACMTGGLRAQQTKVDPCLLEMARLAKLIIREANRSVVASDKVHFDFFDERQINAAIKAAYSSKERSALSYKKTDFSISREGFDPEVVLELHLDHEKIAALKESPQKEFLSFLSESQKLLGVRFVAYADLSVNDDPSVRTFYNGKENMVVLPLSQYLYPDYQIQGQRHALSHEVNHAYTNFLRRMGVSSVWTHRVELDKGDELVPLDSELASWFTNSGKGGYSKGFALDEIRGYEIMKRKAIAEGLDPRDSNRALNFFVDSNADIVNNAIVFFDYNKTVPWPIVQGPFGYQVKLHILNSSKYFDTSKAPYVVLKLDLPSDKISKEGKWIQGKEDFRNYVHEQLKLMKRSYEGLRGD